MMMITKAEMEPRAHLYSLLSRLYRVGRSPAGNAEGSLLPQRRQRDLG